MLFQMQVESTKQLFFLFYLTLGLLLLCCCNFSRVHLIAINSVQCLISWMTWISMLPGICIYLERSNRAINFLLTDLQHDFQSSNGLECAGLGPITDTKVLRNTYFPELTRNLINYRILEKITWQKTIIEEAIAEQRDHLNIMTAV